VFICAGLALCIVAAALRSRIHVGSSSLESLVKIGPKGTSGTVQVSHTHTYSHHDRHDDFGHHEKSWTAPSAGGHYGHRNPAHEIVNESMDYASGSPDSPESTGPMYPANRRSFKMAVPSNIDSVRISGRAPLQVVLAAPSLLDDEPPMSEEYSQFGVPDTGAWRGLGSSGNVSAGSEYTERAGKGDMLLPTNTEYHPRSL